MVKIRADLHIHTCLSPCGDDQMRATAIVEQAGKAGLDMIGICDHNSAENAGAVMSAGSRTGLAVIPGMEVTSQEEVHVLGLFKATEGLLDLQTVVYENLPGENDREAFGSQLVIDDRDRVVGTNNRLLIGATALVVEQVVGAIHQFGGLAIASHVDRERFGIIGQLGFIPEGLGLDAVEVANASLSKWDCAYPVVTFSDAHYLEDVGRNSTCFVVEKTSFDEITKALNSEGERRIITSEMEDLSLHILDIAENSILASAGKIEVRIDEDQANDLLTLEISDDGRGMDEQTLKNALDPFFTTKKTRRVGLGLSLLAQAARESGGTMDVSSRPHEGTLVRATFRLSHPDCKPMGDIAETVRTLVVAHPEINFVFEQKTNGSIYRFDSRETKRR
ncbi:MAG: ATP-binding protein [Planctomycetota bacterium]|nr:ATP-binding protein [Planctomycetota bacterium]